MEAKKRRGVGCLIVGMVALAGLGMAGLMLAGLTGGGPAGGIIERIEHAEPGANKKIVILPITGILAGGRGDPTGTGPVLKMLERAGEDESVAAVLLHIDSPGGAVTDADLIHQRVKKLRETGRPVMALMGDICASGGYYVAVAAEEIWAHPTTITGSIGVIIPSINFAELMARYGVADVSVASGDNKAVLSPTRPMTPEQRLLIQGVVDELFERFTTLVAEGRKLEPAAVAPYADGRIFTAKTALEGKLIDQIGYEEAALAHLKTKVGGKLSVVRYGRQLTFREMIGVSAPERPFQVWERVLATPRAMYLYAPW